MRRRPPVRPFHARPTYLSCSPRRPAARRTPSRWRTSDQTLSYRDLDIRANQLAHHLRALGVGPETIVALCVERSFDMVVALIAILKAGAAYLPLDPNYPKERLDFMLTDAAAPLLVTHGALRQPARTSARVVRLDVDAARIDRHPTSAPLPPRPSHAAYVIYTSGSTGKPKGVTVTHHNVLRLFDTTQHLFRFGADDVWSLFHSFAFDFSVWEIWRALLHGGRLVVVPYATSRSPADFSKLLVREGVTVLNRTPSAFYQLMEAARTEGAFEREQRLRYVIFGGEALDFRSARRMVSPSCRRCAAPGATCTASRKPPCMSASLRSIVRPSRRTPAA